MKKVDGKTVKGDDKLDPNVLPTNPHNKQCAKKLGMRFDPKKGFYVDDDGCSTYDRFGQPL